MLSAVIFLSIVNLSLTMTNTFHFSTENHFHFLQKDVKVIVNMCCWRATKKQKSLKAFCWNKINYAIFYDTQKVFLATFPTADMRQKCCRQHGVEIAQECLLRCLILPHCFGFHGKCVIAIQLKEEYLQVLCE